MVAASVRNIRWAHTVGDSGWLFSDGHIRLTEDVNSVCVNTCPACAENKPREEKPEEYQIIEAPLPNDDINDKAMRILRHTVLCIFLPVLIGLGIFSLATWAVGTTTGIVAGIVCSGVGLAGTIKAIRADRAVAATHFLPPAPDTFIAGDSGELPASVTVWKRWVK